MKLGLSEGQFKEVDLFLQERSKIQADIDAFELRQGSILSRLEPMERQSIQAKSLMPGTPVEILQRNGCAGSLLQLFDDVLPGARLECVGLKVREKGASRHGEGNDRDPQKNEDSPASQIPQYCSFCGSPRARS